MSQYQAFVFLYYGKWHVFEGVVIGLYKLCTFLWPITVQEISMAFVKLDLCRDVHYIQLLKQGQLILSLLFLLLFLWNANGFFFVYRNHQLLPSLISLKYRWIFFVWTETVTYFFLFYFFSYFFFKQINFFVYRDHQLVLSFSFFLLFLYEIQINFFCIQRPSMNSFSFISSLIYLWNTDKFLFLYEMQIIFFIQRPSVNSLSSILLIFLYEIVLLIS